MSTNDELISVLVDEGAEAGDCHATAATFLSQKKTAIKMPLVNSLFMGKCGAQLR
jgi:hypothetical protein